MRNKIHLPKKENKLVTWAENFIVELIANASLWNVLTVDVEVERTAFNRFKSWYRIANTPSRTNLFVAQKADAYPELVTLIHGLTGSR
jgi:hypothetical protein